MVAQLPKAKTLAAERLQASAEVRL